MTYAEFKIVLGVIIWTISSIGCGIYYLIKDMRERKYNEDHYL